MNITEIISTGTLRDEESHVTQVILTMIASASIDVRRQKSLYTRATGFDGCFLEKQIEVKLFKCGMGHQLVENVVQYHLSENTKWQTFSRTCLNVS